MRTSDLVSDVVREADRAILRAPDRDAMLDATCHVAVAAGFRLAWIGLRDRTTDWLLPVAAAGDASDYLDGLRVSVDPARPEGQGPSGTAVTTGRIAVVDDLWTDPAFAPWRERAAAAGLRSAAAFPLHDGSGGGPAVGAMTIYHDEPGFLDDEALRRLEAIADDLSMGLRLHRALDASRAAEERYRTLFERSVEGIFRTTAEGQVVEVNPSLAAMLGFDSPAQMLVDVDNVRELYAVPEARNEVLRLMREHGQVAAHEVPIRRRDGETVWLAMTARRLTTELDGIDGLEGMVVDVTGRRLAQDARDRRDDILEAVSAVAEILLRPDDWEESIDEVLATLGRGTGTSRTALFRIWRDESDQLVAGRPRTWTTDPTYDLTGVAELQAVPFEAAGYGRWARLLEADEPIVGLTRDFPASEQALLDAFGVRSAAIVPVTVDGDLWGWLGFDDCERERVYSASEVEVLRAAARILGAAVARDRDRQAVVEARDELGRRTRELERSNRELEQFAYVVSHDLQEPLRMITGFLGLLERRHADQLDETAREYIDFAVDGARRQQRMIEDLLAYSRVNTRASEPRPTDLGPAVDAALANLQATIDDTAATIHVPQDSPRLLVDDSQLVQLLQNLVGNALRFRREDPPEVTVGVQPGDDGMFEITVADNGIGVPVEHRERIFDVFQRLHTREEYDGTGIGLAICRRVAERHGGGIWVDDAPGGGARFHVTFPAAGP